jgi:hypothetical protein
MKKMRFNRIIWLSNPLSQRQVTPNSCCKRGKNNEKGQIIFLFLR